MLREVEWSKYRSYKTGSENEPLQFYLDALCNSQKFDLLLGYFSSSAISVLSLGFATFLSSGGKMRLVVNNILSSEDRDVIKAARDGGAQDNYIDIMDIKGLRKVLDEYGRHFFECLAWLIASKRIQISIIKPKIGKGIAHYKSGLFSDGVDSVSFKASCNFTAFGLLENLEELDAFLSWEDSRSGKMISQQMEDFEEIFLGKAAMVEYLEVDDITVALAREFGNRSLDELLIQEQELIEKKAALFKNRVISKAIERATRKIEAILREPRFPYPQGPRVYQTQAYENWGKNGRKGILAMATGTGKTLTALNILLAEYNKCPANGYRALVLVPTITLVEQWAREADQFNFQSVLCISSKTDWENEVTTLISTARRIPVSFILISTYASFVKDSFQRILTGFPADTIFIADEAHNLASPQVIRRLKNFPLQRRIGLSATPKRVYDPEGTAEMELFFEDKEPYVYSFSMERAIKENVLCQYYYFPHLIKLTSPELAEYIKISKRLISLAHFAKDEGANGEIIEKLLLARKRIIHKASNKLEAVVDILRRKFQEEGSLKYTFVYVPEGQTFEIREEGNEPVEENVRIINQYIREIAKIDDRTLMNQFISGMPDRYEILQQFQDGRIDVLASMKCLDEGVDIPRAQTAIFCSSTGNPRQFIQRRGRILRKHPDKEYAVIHDLVVLPDFEAQTAEEGAFELEKGLVRKELERVMYFASLSRNPYFTEDVFAAVCSYYNLNIYVIQSELAPT